MTRLLEAYAGEPIAVTKILQAFDSSDGRDTDLDLPPGASVLRRRVLLRGRRSGQAFLYAEAVVAPGRVPPAVLDGLQATDKPIGVLLAESRTETFREILRVSCEPAGSCGAHLGTGAAADVFARTYRIVAGGQPIVLITEKFPVAGFTDRDSDPSAGVMVSPTGPV